MKKSIIAVIVLALIATMFAGCGSNDYVYHNPTSLPAIQERVEAHELTTLKYKYSASDIYTTEANQFFGYDVPGTSMVVVYTYEGVIALGFRFTNNTLEFDVNEETATITVEMPEVEILSHTSLGEKVNVVKNAILEPINDKIEAINSAIEDGRRMEEASALSDSENIYAAEEAFKTYCKSLLNSIPGVSGNYTIQFK